MPDINVKVRVDESELEKLEKKLSKNNKVHIDVSAVGKAGREVQNLDTSIKNIAATKLKFDAFRLLQQQCGEAVKSVKELNEAMTLVNMTMLDLPDGKLQDLALQSLEMAKELSAYTKTVTDAITIFANTNESVAGILNKAQPTVLLATAANMSASNAADTIQGIMNQFEMADDQAMKIADTIEKLSSEIALDFSKGVSTISEAVSTGGSVINEAGMTFERYGAIVSATAERTRLSGTVIGNAYKTITARISRSKDGETSPEDIAKAEEAFNSVGVTIRNEMGDFRDLSETLDDLNNVWGTLNKSQRSYVAEQAAGVRQKNVFIAMMNEYSRALELEEAALNASGTAMEINEVRAESIDGKMQKLSATMSEMYNHAVSEDAIKGMLDFADSVMGVVDNLGLMQGALAAAGVVGVSNMVNVLKTHWKSIFTAMTTPTSLIAIGVGTAVAAWSAYQRSIEEAVSSAREAASAWSETNSSLEEQVQKVRGLREALAKGNLTEEEAYQVKSDLFDIQQQLSESYGDQADGIDLVNGKLETQIGLIERLNKSQANEFLNENMKAVQKAEKEMTKSRQLDLGRVQFYNNTDDWNVINDIISKYSDYITAQTDSDGFTTSIYFTGDATEAKEVLNDFFTDVRSISDEISDENILNGIEKSASASLNKANEILDEYQDLYKQAQQARLIADEDLYGTGDTQKTAIEWVNKYTKAVENYNDAILSGDNSKISDAAMEFDIVNASIQDLVANSGMTKYADQIGEVRDQLNDTAIASLNFKNTLDGTDTSDLGKQLKSYANDIKELNLKDIDFRIALETGGTQQGEEAIKGLADAADEAGISVDQLIDILTELGYIQGEIANSELGVEVSVSLSISETVDELNTKLKPAFDSLKSAWQDIFTDDGFALNEIDILSTCDSIKSKLDEIAEFNPDLDNSAYEDFVRVLTNTESTAEDVDNAFDSLATSITNAALSGVEDFEIMKAALEDLGVVNNELVAFDALISNTEALKEAGLDLVSVSQMETDEANTIISAFAEEMVSTDNLSQAIAMLTFQKELCNLQEINTSSEIANLRALAENAGYTGEVIQYLTELEQIYQAVSSGVYGTNTQQVAIAQTRAAELNKLIAESAGKVEYKPQVDFSGATKAAKKAGSSAGKSYKDAFQEQLDNLKSVLSGIIGLIDKDIDKLGDQKDATADALETEKEVALDALESERDARLEVVEAQKKQLEQQIKLIDEQIKQKEKIIDGIQDEIDSMKDANAERQRQIDLQKAQYELERMQNQRTILQYSEEKGMHYVTDANGVRDAKDNVEYAKLEIEIAQKQKQIDLIEKEIDLLEERKSQINEQIDLLDEESERISKYYDELISNTQKMYDQMIKETESYWDSLIKGMEDYKSRWEELQEVEDQAKLIAQLKELGLTTEDITNMSAEAFENFKDRYLSALLKVNEGNTDVQNYIAELGGSAGLLQPVSDALDDTASSMDNLDSSASNASSSVNNISGDMDSLSTSTTGLSENINDISDALTNIPEADKFNAIADAFTNLGKSIKDVATALGISEEGTVGGLVGALQSIKEVSLGGDNGEGIISQFNNLKTAVNEVTSAISGGGSSSGQGSDASSSASTSMSAGANGEGSTGTTDSLTSAITSMGETANEVIGESDAEGDGTVIGEFGSLETAVNDVTEAIGIGGDEGSGDGGGQADDDTLIGSITTLGETTEEVLTGGGESGGVIGRFEEFSDVISEAEDHVKGISEGLDEIDGKEVECTITINVKQNGSASGLGMVTGSAMNLNSATYNAKLGAAYAEGTALVQGNWAVQSEEKNALLAEIGPEIVVRDGRYHVIGLNGAEMFRIKPGDIVFNAEQSAALLKYGKISGRGKAYADGTIGDKFASGVLRPLQPGDRAYELQQKMNDYLAKMGGDTASLLTPVSAMQKNMEQMTQALKTINNINNSNNRMQNVVNEFHITMPNVTDSTAATELMKDLQALATKKMQFFD